MKGKMHKFEPNLNLIKNIAFGLILISSLIIFLLPITTETKYMIVTSGSMSPAMNAGDLIVVSTIDTEKIQVNDVISFTTGGEIITHRVIEIDYVHEKFKTKGDANEDPDIRLVDHSQVVGKVILIVPFVGHVAMFVRTLPGLSLFIILPGILIIGYEIRKILNYKKEKQDKNLIPVLVFLLMVLLVIGVCFTTAYFSDVEVSVGNVIQAAESWNITK